MAKHPVVVYGASGYTGMLIMDWLIDQNIPFTAIARNAGRAKEMMAQRVVRLESAKYEILEVEHNVDSLAKAFSGAKVVCNTVGPFFNFGLVAVEAALKAGCHYLDTTGEQHYTHLHDFLIDGMTYAMFEIDDVVDFADPGTTADDRKIRLQAVLKPGSRFVYRYDFGDGWNHAVVVEKMETIESQPWGEAQVIGGARACPPEDVGGPSGYERFLNTLSNDPDSEKAERYRDWIGSGFDAELFDLRAANAALSRMASNRWGNR